MPLNTIYMVRWHQTWETGGKAQENVFFFDHTAGTGVASDLADAFNTVYVPAINALQTATLKNVAIEVINMGDLADFGYFATAGIGAITGEALPPFAAVAYTLKVSTRAVRKGSKRFSGVPEAVQAQGVITDAGYLADIEALRIILQTELVDASDTWLPVIVKRVKEAVAGTTPVQYTYRLPTTDLELVTGEVVVALTTPNVGHQVSREL